MTLVREFLASALFVFGVFSLVYFFTDHFDWIYFAAAVAAFLIAYFVWPSKKRGKRDDDNGFLDTVELVIEFPVELVVWLFRLVGRVLGAVFGGKGDGIDFDI
ncbi:hypothetical protein [Alteromonas macleodii]|uniref:Uncharacterized protein n=2 Tax=Alteromonas macleodii TaxID=28108 RepID=A0AB36FL22_ALTMA|nr:hypothetical protein [Alteromonas macleodii]OES24159.1 hypothetical protein BFV93_4759 [Alteromonas macleodii]OES24793.1 hypothetical protein BFV95_4552 [Alteromonas macleodii]OES25071.1 hypothetical protein BFV94_4542 [Alteromonas macleodii]OES39114.1 hypothetical protein BFV96_4262 [Alteromonas macleodii]